MAQGTKDYTVPALEKAILILNALSDEELSIGDLHTQLKLPKTTTFVILNTLEQYEIIRKTPSGKYQLGSGVLRWGNRYLSSMDMVQTARPHLQNFVEGTPYTAHLAVLIGDKPVYCDKVEGSGFVRFATSIGQGQPLYRSSVGKALALGMTPEEIKRALPKEMNDTPSKGARSLEKFLEDIEFVREHGFSIEDEEFEEGIRCIGAPIRNSSGNVVASMSITALSKDLPAVKFMKIGEQIKETAALISRDLGYMDDRLETDRSLQADAT
ncbi:IclR family transcriptional regulator [Paenibacillus eucommiae]|uniref:IclR family acetate operon transcriptional repressor n=1 Tax=Paenibacillus eucommiae TaxID=1355755 RepID=A0ABS4IT72_9BACL|nr:IclR family transcriptional regulator [Paenibacillus eucommiae]MBP1990771.1 IclR family acetate operon transcriptional repressor [Paenibacillus eucommiae]